MKRQTAIAIIAASIAVNLADAATTLAGLSAGATEGNALAAPIVGQLVPMLAVKVAVGTIAALIVLSVDVNWLRRFGVAAIVLLPLAAAAHNLIVA